MSKLERNQFLSAKFIPTEVSEALKVIKEMLTLTRLYFSSRNSTKENNWREGNMQVWQLINVQRLKVKASKRDQVCVARYVWDLWEKQIKVVCKFVATQNLKVSDKMRRVSLATDSSV